VANGRLHITVEGSNNFPDGATATATIAGPDGQRYEVPLDRVGSTQFEAEMPAARSGTYAVGVNVTSEGETVLASSTLASESYPAEYAPGASDDALMARVSSESGGRGEITAEQAWDRDGLAAGFRRLALAGPFLLFAALLWPIAVALSRLSLRGATVAGARSGVAAAGRRLRGAVPRLGAPDPDNAPAPSTAAPRSKPTTPRAAPPTTKADGSAVGKQTAAVNELLAKKRARQSGGDEGSGETG
jgi:hypothetical protein